MTPNTGTRTPESHEVAQPHLLCSRDDRCQRRTAKKRVQLLELLLREIQHLLEHSMEGARALLQRLVDQAEGEPLRDAITCAVYSRGSRQSHDVKEILLGRFDQSWGRTCMGRLPLPSIPQ